ncbi:hypothetical protein [Hymenobacter sp. UYCo722]|uniref:hypothetical protein n=1 Tax=Hymenobacter sp. UYCo722 TaxID=3156335 RepID=UPI0033992A68
MPKLIDYPRTSYTGAWELSEIVDDTGGKCSVENAARKLDRKVSGSFKAIIGSAVKFGLMTSKRELLTTTTLFRRIKHAYDKAEELQFHREAFLTPPLFTQICRKFRDRELPVQMLDVMLIREFGVEEINAQNVARAFVDGCRMCGLIDERNIIADIDVATNRASRRMVIDRAPEIQKSVAEEMDVTAVTNELSHPPTIGKPEITDIQEALGLYNQQSNQVKQKSQSTSHKKAAADDPIATLFGLDLLKQADTASDTSITDYEGNRENDTTSTEQKKAYQNFNPVHPVPYIIESQKSNTVIYQMQMSGPGVNSSLDIIDEDDIGIAIALLEKIRRQLRSAI